MKAKQIIDRYIKFFQDRGHKQIANSPLVPENDPTTLFTSSGMQPLVPYLLGEAHPGGTRLVNVQNSFRAQDIEEVGDNRHTTFFRMIGNWSLGDYFKADQLPWFFKFLTKELGLDPKKLYVTVFDGDKNFKVVKNEKYQPLTPDVEAKSIWVKLFESVKLNPEERISFYGPEKNWWSRSGVPASMPIGEPGGPDSEVFYDFGTPHDKKFGEKCHVNCDCGRFLEIGNSVFMQYKKMDQKTFEELPKQNVDFGGGLERLVAVTEQQQDIFQTSLFAPIIKSLESETDKSYKTHAKNMRIVADHLTGSAFIISNNVKPSNKEQGYILRRLLRRSFDYFYALQGKNISKILNAIIFQYKDTDPVLEEKYEEIKNTILEEEQKYERARHEAQKFIQKRYKKTGDDLMGVTEITPSDAFILYSTHGLSPTQIKSLGYVFDEQKFAALMKTHKDLSRTASAGRFKGGLADASELTVKGHTATHLLQQALRDELGPHVFQTGSNITSERLRFDFSHNEKLTPEQIEKVEKTVNERVKEDLPVHFEMMTVDKAKKLGAIGLFDEKYGSTVKVYFIGPSTHSIRSGQLSKDKPYSIEFCGGPHVEHTGAIKSFKITKQEKLGVGQMRIYAVVQ